MKKLLSKLSVALFLMSYLVSYAQENLGIGTNSPHPSALLDVTSSEKGMLIPRMTTPQRDAIQNPAEALQIFNLTTNCLEIYVPNQWHPIWCFPDEFECEHQVADIEGNIYQTVQIGSQCWFKENLKTTKYNDGSNIPNITDNASWGSTSSGAYCWYNNDYATYGTVYGALYNWFAAASGNLCPTGWRVPTDDDWKEMEMYLGMIQSEADATGWRGTDQGKQIKDVSMDGSNSSGFTAIAGGWRVPTYFSSVENIGAYFWTSSENTATHSWMRLLHKPKYAFNDPDKIFRIGSGQDGNKLNGMSVRCLKE